MGSACGRTASGEPSREPCWDRPNKKYSAYVAWNGQLEVTIGTNFAYRESARPATKFDHWAVQAVSARTTVCGFITRAN